MNIVSVKCSRLDRVSWTEDAGASISFQSRFPMQALDKSAQFMSRLTSNSVRGTIIARLMSKSVYKHLFLYISMFKKKKCQNYKYKIPKVYSYLIDPNQNLLSGDHLSKTLVGSIKQHFLFGCPSRKYLATTDTINWRIQGDLYHN